MTSETILLHGTRRLRPEGVRTDSGRVNELLHHYLKLIQQPKLGWTEHLRLQRMLGTGGQGVVYLSERRGADSFTLPVALKFFSPERFPDERSYREAMERMAQVSSRVAQIQHDNLLDVQNFIERRRIRMLEMEWVDGYDLDTLLAPEMLERAQGPRQAEALGVHQQRDRHGRATPYRASSRAWPWRSFASVLAGLAALHREEIVHGDIKPSNIMIKRTGNAKIIDIGSALDLNNMPQQKTCTPQYAAPEMLDREEVTPRSDLASWATCSSKCSPGRPLFAGIRDYATLLEEADAAAVVAQSAAARSSSQRTVDDDLPAAHGARSDAALRDRRTGGHRQRGPCRVPADAGARRSGKRV